MHPHAAKIVAEARFHQSAGSRIKWLSGRAQHVVDDRRHSRRLFLVDGLALQTESPDAALSTLPSRSRSAPTRAVALQQPSLARAQGRPLRTRRSNLAFLYERTERAMPRRLGRLALTAGLFLALAGWCVQHDGRFLSTSSLQKHGIQRVPSIQLPPQVPPRRYQVATADVAGDGCLPRIGWHNP